MQVVWREEGEKGGHYSNQIEMRFMNCDIPIHKLQFLQAFQVAQDDSRVEVVIAGPQWSILTGRIVNTCKRMIHRLKLR